MIMGNPQRESWVEPSDVSDIAVDVPADYSSLVASQVDPFFAGSVIVIGILSSCVTVCYLNILWSLCAFIVSLCDIVLEEYSDNPKMAGAAVMKVEMDCETCCLCGSNSELMTPEEFDASAPPVQAPLRTMLLHLNNNKVIPQGRLCALCIRRAVDSYEFTSALNTQTAPPLSEKIRALRRRLHQLTQRIDVFIVVGGPTTGAGGTHTYSEDDIIVVEKDALAAATAADDDHLHAKNAKGDTVYQCSVCPMSFQRLAEYREHCSTHPEDALHSCWTCGAQFETRDALNDHSTQHVSLHQTTCYLCDTTFQGQSELRRHEPSCPARCPVCGSLFPSRSTLSAHVSSSHGRGHPPPLACAACFRAFGDAELLSAHMLRHRQDKQFVCGYGDCVLRFGTRSNLMSHIRAAHAALAPDPAPDAHACHTCDRTFASVAALKRHARVHNKHQPDDALAKMEPNLDGELLNEAMVEYVMEEGEGENVEYLEVETLDEDQEYQLVYEEK